MQVSVPTPELKRTWLQRELELFASISGAADWLLVGCLCTLLVVRFSRTHHWLIWAEAAAFVVIKILAELLEHKAARETAELDRKEGKL